MGSCCSSSSSGEEADSSTTEELENTHFTKGGAKDVSHGPIKRRGCTDIICIPLFILNSVVFIIVTMAYYSNGNIAKLYSPRDFKGDYCGVETQWNDGTDFSDYKYLTYTMNLTSSLQSVVEQFICSSLFETALTDALSGSDYSDSEQASYTNEYQCGCCKIPCGSCAGDLDQTDITSSSGLTSISGMLNEFAGNSNDFFSTTGYNTDFFTNMWSTATQYFNMVCAKKCDITASDMSNSTKRSYAYWPAANSGLKNAWRIVKASTVSSSASLTAIQYTMSSSWTFDALPYDVCKYDEAYCVPFPGVTYEELLSGSMYCTFVMDDDVLSTVGTATAEAFTDLASSDLASSFTEDFGSYWGDFMDSLDVFAITAVCSFIIGMIFLVLLRFFVGVVVWVSIVCVWILFIVGGAVLWLRGVQCSDAGIFETGYQTTTAVTVTVTTAVSDAVSGTSISEDMTGKGGDYRGAQSQTVNGYTCKSWSETSVYNQSSAYSPEILTGNYCRNPDETAYTIYCYTTDDMVDWETCLPIGVITGECPSGYAVDSEDMRTALQIFGYIVWGLCVLFIIFVLCMCSRIMLAISINKVAAMFIYHTPTVVLIPVVQAVVSILWVLTWGVSAAFLVSQVPDTWVPTTAYATYAEAYGTADDAGACNGDWPQGSVWNTFGDLSAANDECSGYYGDVSNITPKCWRCYPPRYVLDEKFFISLFTYLWNAAFLIALGQLLIAGAVAVWFFTPKDEKRKVFSVKQSLGYAFRYHIGTVAFGSFIVALVQFIRYVLQYFEQQAKAQKNQLLVALLGKNFCQSAKAAFFLVFRNMLRFAAVAMLGTIIEVVGFIFIMASSVTVGYFILVALHPNITPTLPVLVYFCMAYLCARLYITVFGMAVDTMLQCFIATEEIVGKAGMDGLDFVPSDLAKHLKNDSGKEETTG